MFHYSGYVASRGGIVSVGVWYRRGTRSRTEVKKKRGRGPNEWVATPLLRSS